MTGTLTKPSFDWSCDQIDKYREMHPRYRQYAETLREVLSEAIRQLAPLAVVQTRPKAIASFAEKIQRKWPETEDPVHQFTDLCGGRVITFTQPEVRTICEFIVRHFDIDWENSVDVSQRLKPSEFGYRSVHYIVQFRPGLFPTDEVAVTVPDAIVGLKAEIQVRTLLEHAWAGFSHDRVYKSVFSVPEKWQRELAGVAAMLEQADEAFSRIEQGLQRYEANYGAYMTEDQMREEMALLEIVRSCDPENPGLAHRVGKLAMSLGDWPKAVEIFEEHLARADQPILRDLGVSLCKLYEDDPRSAEYRRGQQLLQRMCDMPDRDPDALASLAGTWKTQDPEKARKLYAQAFEAAPTDPYAVGNYLAAEIAYRRDLSAIPLMAPAIAAAVQHCRDQIAVGMNLPWAYYDLGTFQLLLNHAYESLSAVAKAIQLSAAGWFAASSLQSLRQLEIVRRDLEGYAWVHRLLTLALIGKYGLEEYRATLEDSASPDAKELAGPVVIIAGGCQSSVEMAMKAYRPLLVDGLRDFRGTLISGGTTAGISGLAGDLQEIYPTTVYTVGYIPALIPPDVRIDNRYREQRQTVGHDFDAYGPLQYWADIITSGIAPGQVTLLGIGGGIIAAAEYRMALALGARVVIVEGSGRSAARLLGDEEWNRSANLIRLPNDPKALHDLLTSL